MIPHQKDHQLAKLSDNKTIVKETVPWIINFQPLLPAPDNIQTTKKQETNITGVYAAGDICGRPWQMAKAVGEGCVAGIEAATYAKQLTIAAA